jgi:hypothetical protein
MSHTLRPSLNSRGGRGLAVGGGGVIVIGQNAPIKKSCKWSFLKGETENIVEEDMKT